MILNDKWYGILKWIALIFLPALGTLYFALAKIWGFPYAAEIVGIAVSDNARRKGIGKQLIQRVMESENLESIKAQTDDDSIGFYRKCGFSDERIVIEYPDGSAVRYNCVLHK